MWMSVAVRTKPIESFATICTGALFRATVAQTSLVIANPYAVAPSCASSVNRQIEIVGAAAVAIVLQRPSLESNTLMLLPSSAQNVALVLRVWNEPETLVETDDHVPVRVQ